MLPGFLYTHSVGCLFLPPTITQWTLNLSLIYRSDAPWTQFDLRVALRARAQVKGEVTMGIMLYALELRVIEEK